MQEVKSTPERQNQSFKKNQPKKKKTKQIVPFILKRQPYSQLNIYEKKGHWSQKQKIKYAVFLSYFKERFQVKAKRRFNNIFDYMAIFIKTRNSQQCRSHHQKMQIEKFKIDNIIESTSLRYRPNLFNIIRQKYLVDLQNIDIEQPEEFEAFKQRIELNEILKAQERQKRANKQIKLRSEEKKLRYRLRRKNKQTIQNMNGQNCQNKVQKAAEVQVKSIQNPETEQKLPLTQVKYEQNVQVYNKEPIIDIDLVQQSKFHPRQSFRRQQTLRSPSFPPHMTKPMMPNYPPPLLSYQPQSLIRPPSHLKQPMSHHVLSKLHPMERIHSLEQSRKQHLDLAYYHYNQYLRHTSLANNLQYEIFNEIPMNHSLSGHN